MTHTTITSAHLDEATSLGVEYALLEISQGSRGPRDYPLSGEWADAVSPGDVYRAVMSRAPGVLSSYDDLEDLCDQWEAGYQGTWMSHLDSVVEKGLY